MRQLTNNNNQLNMHRQVPAVSQTRQIATPNLSLLRYTLPSPSSRADTLDNTCSLFPMRILRNKR